MKPVLVTSIGGLGNQMFCYAFYKKLCREYPQIPFKMDLSEVYDKRYDRNAEFLRVFPNIQVPAATAGEIWEAERKLTFTYRGKGSRFIRLAVDKANRYFMKKRKPFCMTEESFRKCRDNREKREGKINWNEIRYFDGYWQTIAYYEDFLQELKQDFTFAPLEDEENQALLCRMQSQESVSVHVRRGDYVGETLDILDTAYYSEIIKNIQKERPESWFYFFTNDAAYVEKEYEWLEKKKIVKNNTKLESFRDMQLMSACRHNVIANSTFSIWAALLNDSPERKVYYPSYYYEGIPMQDIRLPGFIRVTVKGQERNRV